MDAAFTPPFVTSPIVEIPVHLDAWIRDIVRRSDFDERFGLSHGPKEYLPIAPMFAKLHSLSAGTIDLYTTRGRVAAHRDGAGDTYGLVLIADNGHDLFVGSRPVDRDPALKDLAPGSVYHLDSNEDHGTSCRGDSENDLLAVLTLDFYSRSPTLPYEDFAAEALAALERGYAKEAASETGMQSLTTSREER